MAEMPTILTLGGFLICCAARGAEPVAYDGLSARWLVDRAAAVSKNDVLYLTPSIEPWEAMPVGGGDLSAMVRCGGASLDLHLTKSDAWGFAGPPDAPPGSRFFNNVSPGHLRLAFGPKAGALARERFRQRLDLYRGRILIELSEWRPAMKLTASSATIHAAEIHQRPARPHLANTGMEDYFAPGEDPLLGRGTAVAVGAVGAALQRCSADAKRATMRLDTRQTPRFHVVIAAAVTPRGDPLAAARDELQAAIDTPLADMKHEHQAWWEDWWSRSLLRIHSPDQKADWLSAAYHVHLYSLACANRGPVPCKWDGGAGLMRGDERTWGLSEWVQEIRFTYLPLYAANRLEMARGLASHYSRMRPYLLEQTRRTWGVAGLWIPETTLPWGHAEDFVLRDAGPRPAKPYFLAWNPKTAPYGRFERYNGYVGFLFTAGPARPGQPPVAPRRIPFTSGDAK